MGIFGPPNIGELKAKKDVKNLIKSLRNRNSDIRLQAAQALGEIRDKRAVEPLVKTLNDEIDWVQLNAASALGEIGDERAVEPLIAALKDKEFVPRSRAAKALGKIKAPNAVESLIAALKDKDEGVRSSAAEALGNIGDTSAIKSLIKTLKEKNRYVRENSVKALKKMGWKPGNDTEKVYYLIAVEDWDELVKIGKPAVDPLIKLLKCKGLYYQDYIGKASVVKALGEIGDPRAVDPIIRASKDKDENIRKESEKALGKIKDPVAEEAIVQYFKQNYMLDELVKIGKPAVETLIQFLEHKCKYMRERAAKSLGEIKDARAVEPLIQLLKDEDTGVRRESIKALGKIIDIRAVEPLIQTLQDEDRDVRMKSTEALGKIKDIRAIEPLIKILKDESGVQDYLKSKLSPLASVNTMDVYYDDDSPGHANYHEHINEIAGLSEKIDMSKEICTVTARALESITGQNLGNQVDRWQKWWEAQR